MTGERRSIWIVTQGEYSGHEILCAYEREEDARAAMEAGVGDDYRELPLLPRGHIPHKVRVHHMGVRGDGVIDRFEYTSDEWDFNVGADVNEFQAAGSFHISGPDKGRVVKAAQDRAARLLAEREGIA